MTDPTPAPAPVAAPVIQVNANPAQDQAEALVRQVLAAAGLIVATLGAAKAAGVLNVLAALAGPIVTVLFGAVGLGAILWGQVKTRRLAQKAAAMANALPDSVAVAK